IHAYIAVAKGRRECEFRRVRHRLGDFDAFHDDGQRKRSKQQRRRGRGGNRHRSRRYHHHHHHHHPPSPSHHRYEYPHATQQQYQHGVSQRRVESKTSNVCHRTFGLPPFSHSYITIGAPSFAFLPSTPPSIESEPTSSSPTPPRSFSSRLLHSV